MMEEEKLSKAEAFYYADTLGKIKKVFFSNIKRKSGRLNSYLLYKVDDMGSFKIRMARSNFNPV